MRVNWNLCASNFLGNRSPASLLEKKRVFPFFSLLPGCSSNNSQRFHFFVHFSFNSFFCMQIFLFTRCEVENDNRRQWLQNNCFFARKQLLELDLTEESKTNPYVQFSVFSNDLLSLICLNEDPRMDQLLKVAKWWIIAWLRSLQLIFCF